MKIATWNVNGIRARQSELQDFLERERPDVLCLQEIKASLDQLPLWLADTEGYWLTVGRTLGARDVVDTGRLQQTQYSTSSLPRGVLG